MLSFRKPVPTFREHTETDMIALTADCRKWVVKSEETATNRRVLREISSHGIVSGILLLPYFCPPPAPLACEKITLRWPGPFGSGFLSPQPPGAVGIGPVRRGVNPDTGPTKVGPFSFVGASAILFVIPERESASFARVALWLTRGVLCRRRRALRPASRDCRPGHRRPRHRRRRGKYLRAARSSFPNCRSSRQPSGGCALRCSR